jgi:hypothetical protein
MKKLATRILMVLAVSLMATTAIFAEDKGKEVTFFRDMTVNGTTVKKGNYKVVYNEQSNEISIMKGKTVVAKAPAHAESRASKANETEIKATPKDQGSILRSVTFAGDSRTIVINEDSNQTATPSN